MMTAEKARMYDAIELQAAIQWERAKGEMRALVELLGKVPTEYNENGVHVNDRHWNRLQGELDAFIAKVEHNDWHMPDRV